MGLFNYLINKHKNLTNSKLQSEENEITIKENLNNSNLENQISVIRLYYVAFEKYYAYGT